MATKKQHEQFNKQIEKLLISIGAEKSNSHHFSSDYKGFEYTTNTYAGLLFISCHPAEKSEVFSIYLRFKDYDAALLLLGYDTLGMNPKWNIHTWDAESAITELKRKLNRVACLKEKFITY